MKKLAMFLAIAGAGSAVSADTQSIGFESSEGYVTGTIKGQTTGTYNPLSWGGTEWWVGRTGIPLMKR